MLIVITTPHLSSSDTALLEAAALKEACQIEEVKIVLSGDGVYASTLHSSALSALISSAAVVAVKGDVISRGVQIHGDIQLINHTTFAALSAQHQQWVTL